MGISTASVNGDDEACSHSFNDIVSHTHATMTNLAEETAREQEPIADDSRLTATFLIYGFYSTINRLTHYVHLRRRKKTSKREQRRNENATVPDIARDF